MSDDPSTFDPAGDPLDSARWEKLFALQRAVGKTGFVRDLVGIFLRDAPERLEGIREALATGDAETAERIAHSLKGSGGNVGALHVGSLAAAIEQLAEAGDLDRAAALLGNLAAEIDRAVEALRKKSEEAPGSS